VPSAPGLSALDADVSLGSAKANSSRTRIRPRNTLTALVALTVGVPFCLAVATGSLSIPHNDGWSYSKIAQVFAKTSQIHLLSWNRAALIGQLVMLGPLGRWIWVQQAAVSVLAVIALLLIYMILARRLTPTRAVLGTALVAVFPGFGLLATSFMENIPALAAAVGCLAVADIALERRSSSLLAVALVIGFFGATIREDDLVVPAALVLAALFAWGRQKARVILSMAVVFVAAVIVFEMWRTGLPYGDHLSPELTLHAGAIDLARAYLTLALLLSPVVLVSGVLRRPSRLGAALSVPAALLGITSVVFLHPSIFLGNYLSSNGAYVTAFIGSPVIIPAVVMDILVALALISGVALPAIVVTRWRDLDPMLRGVTILTILGTVGEGFLGQLIVDRDLILLLVPGALLCLHGPAHNSKLRLSAAPLAVLAVVSLLICANALARDAAVWGAANKLVSRGVPATTIDAGFDWVGYHATTPVILYESPIYLGFWDFMFPESHECYAVTTQPLLGETLIQRIGYQTYAFPGLGSSEIDVYRLATCRPTPTHG
jgi:hypothetical protein